MKKLVIACVAALGLSACGGDSAKCTEALEAYGAAQTLCESADQAADVWFNESACETADDDGYDNTEFYDCLIENFSNEDAAHTCEQDADGNNTAVRQFEDNSQDSDPAGCRELYNATAN